METRTFPRLLIAVVIVVIACVPLTGGVREEREPHITSGKNTSVSDLLHRLNLIETAGADLHSGQYFVKVYRVPQGEECDVDNDLCKGRDLLISVASLDLYGDHALHRVTGLAEWKFIEWKVYAEFDGPGYFTSFVVEITPKAGVTFTECRNRRSGAGKHLTFEVNPWEISCTYGR